MTRQYIGARYMPRFVGVYDPTQAYEALDVVDNGAGTSYISKKPTPAGTPLTDTDFWFVYGSTSGAILDLQTRVGTLETEVDDIQEDLDAGAVLTVSDSYGNQRNSSNKTAPTILSERIGVPVYEYWNGGAGFIDGTLLTGLQSFTTPDDNKVKTIIIFCGANDAYLNAPTAAPPKIVEFVDYCRTRFVNAKRIILCGVGLCMSTMNGAGARRSALVRGYIIGAMRAGISYLANSEYTLHSTLLMQSDMVHPNSTGVEKVADMLTAAYYGNAYDVHMVLDSITMTKHADAPAWFNLNAGAMSQTLDNDVITIKPNNFYYGILSFNTGSAVATIDQTVLYSLCDLTNSFVSGLSTDVGTAFSIPGLFMINGAASIPGVARCIIEDKVLKAYFTRDSSVGVNIANVVGFVSYGGPIVLPTLSY